MSHFKRALTIAAASVLCLAALAACGSDDPAPTPTEPPAQPSLQPTAQPTPTKVPMVAPTIPPTATPTPEPGVTPPQPTPTKFPMPEPTPSERDFAEHFRNRTIEVTVTYAPGGGYDTFGRLFARYAQNHFPGNPRFVVRNLAGAGGERGLVSVLRDGSREGYSTVIVHPRFFKRELLGDDVPEFDLVTTNLIGTPTAVAGQVTSTYMMRERFGDYPMTWEGAVSLAADRGSPLTRGGNAVGDTGTVSETFIEAIGGPIKMVYGYGGSSELMAAFDRGELDIGPCGRANTTALFPEWVDDDRCVPLYRIGPDDPNDDPEYVDWVTNVLGEEIPPHIWDIIDATEGQRRVYELIVTVNDQLARTFALPAGVPEDVVAFWRSAFRATIEDPAFLEAAELLGRDVLYGSPESMLASLDAGRQALEDPSLLDLYTKMSGPAN